MTPELWKAFQKQTKQVGEHRVFVGPGYGEDGYGLFKEQKQLAHRAAYEHYLGKKIPKGYIVAQSCGNKRCVEETHLSAEYVGRV